MVWPPKHTSTDGCCGTDASSFHTYLGSFRALASQSLSFPVQFSTYFSPLTRESDWLFYILE